MKALIIFNFGDSGQQWWSFFWGKNVLKTSVEINRCCWWNLVGQEFVLGG
jgi:hypothetical protein